VFNKAIKKHRVKHSWASQPVPEGEGKPWKTLVLWWQQHFMAAAVTAFKQVKSSSVSCLTLWAEMVDVQQPMSPVLVPFPPWKWLWLLFRGDTLLAVTRMAAIRVAAPTGKQHEVPLAKEESDEEGLRKS